MATNNKPIERLTLSVEEAGKVLGISRATAYSLANQGLLPVVRLGKRILVSKAGLERMINDVKIKVQLNDEKIETHNTIEFTNSSDQF